MWLVFGAQHAIELGASAFREFLRYHTVRRRDGRTWRLVIAGDLFDFMFAEMLPGERFDKARPVVCCLCHLRHLLDQVDNCREAEYLGE
jgi:hypothetical protein